MLCKVGETSVNFDEQNRTSEVWSEEIEEEEVGGDTVGGRKRRQAVVMSSGERGRAAQSRVAAASRGLGPTPRTKMKISALLLLLPLVAAGKSGLTTFCLLLHTLYILYTLLLSLVSFLCCECCLFFLFVFCCLGESTQITTFKQFTAHPARAADKT